MKIKNFMKWVFMKNREDLLRNEKISTLLFRMSLPATIGMLVNALYNIVDTIFVGRGVNALAIGGLTVVFPIQMLAIALSLLVAIGAAANISISFGAGDLRKARKYVGNSYTLATIISLILVVIGVIFIRPLLRLFGASAILMPYAYDYLSIVLIGIVPLALVTVNSSVLRAEGNAKMAMLFVALGTIFNIILDPIFIFGFHMGIRGAAAATALSQITGFLLALSYALRKKNIISVSWQDFRLEFSVVMDIFKLGASSFVRQVSGSVLMIFLNNAVMNFGGEVALSAVGIISRMTAFVFMPMFGVVQGMQPIVGFNFGARQYGRVKEVVKISIRFLLSYCSIALLLVFLFNKSVFRMFTTDIEVITVGTDAMKIMLIAVPVVGVQIIAASFYQAIGLAKPAMFLSLLRQAILLIPLILLLPKLFGLGLLGIWLAYPIADILSTGVSGIMLRKELKRMVA